MWILEKLSCKALDFTILCKLYVIRVDKCSKFSLKSCTEVNLSWDYPTNNLTIIIETPFTQQHQPYAVNLDNYWLFGVQPYRILNGKEIE